MALFTPSATYRRPVIDPETGEKYEVEYRPLDAGDKAEIEDTMQMEAGGDSAQLRLGWMRLLTVQRAVVGWDFPGPSPTPEAIRRLTPDVFELVFSWVSFGAIPPEPEEDEEEQDAAREEPAEVPLPERAVEPGERELEPAPI